MPSDEPSVPTESVELEREPEERSSALSWALMSHCGTSQGCSGMGSVSFPGRHARLGRRHHHLLALSPTRGGGPPAAWARSETSNPPAARRAPRHQYPITRHRAAPAVRLGLCCTHDQGRGGRGRGRCADAARSTTATPGSSTWNDARTERNLRVRAKFTRKSEAGSTPDAAQPAEERSPFGVYRTRYQEGLGAARPRLLAEMQAVCSSPGWSKIRLVALVGGCSKTADGAAQAGVSAWSGVST